MQGGVMYYMMNVVTDFGFSITFHGTVHTDDVLAFLLLDPDELDDMVLTCLNGARVDKNKLHEWCDAIGAIKANPNEPFCNQGRNKWIVWIPVGATSQVSSCSSIGPVDKYKGTSVLLVGLGSGELVVPIMTFDSIAAGLRYMHGVMPLVKAEKAECHGAEVESYLFRVDSVKNYLGNGYLRERSKYLFTEFLDGHNDMSELKLVKLKNGTPSFRFISPYNNCANCSCRYS
jgi:hypothetical protein